MADRKKIKISYRDEKKSRLRRRTIARITAVVLFCVLVIGGLIYLLFFAGIFDVRESVISTPPSVDRNSVQQFVSTWLDEKRLGISRFRNSQLLSLPELEKKLKDQFIRINTVDTYMEDNHRLVVTIEEKKPVGVWCPANSESCFFFDDQGTSFLATNPSSGSLFAIIEDQQERKVNLGDSVTNQTMLSSIQLTRRTLQYGGFGFDKFILPKEDRKEFYVHMIEGWMLKLSTRVSVTDQLEAMFKFFSEKLARDQRLKLEYVDLRIKDRIYYQ